MVRQRYTANDRLRIDHTSKADRPSSPPKEDKQSHEHNVRAAKSYIERRWARGIQRDFTSPDFWKDKLK